MTTERPRSHLWRGDVADADWQFARYDWRSGGGICLEDFEAARELAHDIFLCSAAAVLAEAGHPRYAEKWSGISPVVLLSDELNAFVDQLGQWEFTRFSFRKAMGYVLDHAVIGDATRAAYATYVRPTLRRRELSAGEAEEVWQAVGAFLDRAMRSSVFPNLFLMPIRGPLAVNGVAGEDYDRFLLDFAALARRTVELLGTQGTWSLFSFWITRTQTADLWPSGGEAGDLRDLCTAERTAMRGFNADAGWIDYFVAGCSAMATAMVRESAQELYFPVAALRGRITRDDDNSWLGDDFIDRAWTANFDVVNHPKGRRVREACREYAALDEWGGGGPIELTSLRRAEVIETHRFLTGFTRKHFLGHFAEMFALPLVIRAFGDRLTEESTCVPGTALRLGRMGPDAIIGTVRRHGDDLVAHVHAIVEVKGYDPKTKKQTEKIVEQLHRHRRRLSREPLRLTCTSFDAGGRWALPAEGRQTFTVKRCSVADDALLVAVTPAQPSAGDRFGGAIHEVAMPWTAEGVRELAEGFLLATLRECAKEIDDDPDSSLGREAWAAAVRPFLDDPTLTPEDRRSMRMLSEPRMNADRFHLAFLESTAGHRR